MNGGQNICNRVASDGNGKNFEKQAQSSFYLFFCIRMMAYGCVKAKWCVRAMWECFQARGWGFFQLCIPPQS